MNIKELLFQDQIILEHWGKLCDAKVTYEVVDGVTRIHIRGLAFYSYERALHFLQRDAQAIAAPKDELEAL